MISDAYFLGQRMEALFSTRSPELHRTLRTRVSSSY